MRSPITAAVIASLLALLGLVLPLALLPSGAAIGLYTLRRGAAAGMQVLALALVLAFAAAQLLGFGKELALVGCGIGVPTWLLAIALRRTSNQGIALTVAGGFAAIFVFGTYQVLSDPGPWWTARLEAIRTALPEQGRGTLLEMFDLAELGEQMTSEVANYILLMLFAVLLLARWWQSLLYNAGGFRKEFHALALPRRMSYVVIVLLAAALIGTASEASSPVTDLLHVAMMMFAVHGLAVIHFFAAARSFGSLWLAPIYLLFLFAPPLLAILGIADGLLDLRRLRPSGKADA